MHLRKIDLRGFKSFAEPTEITFNKGITGIVGPNGCGKSNVVDAIKWVLGTLSPKSLRGDEMMDVIFKGGEGMGPAGYAEVALTLENADRKLAIDFDEVVVARRLYSSGESRYLINKADCRLKDVRELFYGTGIGTDNYAIIEQGKIDRLVMSNPVERKAVFEEASGISKYRAKRRETVLKLDRVNQDILRLGDVIREISRETRNIKSQAAKAEKCRALQEELKRKKLQVFLNDYHQATVQVGGLRERLSGLRATIASLDARAAELRAASETAQKEIDLLTTREADTRSRLAQEGAAAAKLEQMISGNRERLAELTDQIDRTDAEQEEVSAKLAEMNSLRESLTIERRTEEEDLAAGESQLQEAADRLRQAVEECGTLTRQLEGKKADLFQVLQRESQYRNEIGHVKTAKETLSGRRERCRARVDEVASEIVRERERSLEIGRSRDRIAEHIETMTALLRSEENASRQLREVLTDCERNVAASQEALQRVLSRRDLLQEMEERLEGTSSGVKGILQNKETGFPGILGTVSDFLDVKPEYLPMIEAVLGEDSTALIAADQESASKAVAFVRENRLGRIGVFSIDAVPSTETTGTVCEYIACPESVAGVMRSIFGRYRVAADIAEARTLLSSSDARPYAYVTREGEIIRSDGRISSGLIQGDMSVLSRKTELRRLQEEIAARRTTADEILRDKEDKNRMIRVSTEKCDVLRQQIYDKNVEHVEVKRALDEADQRRKVLADEEGLLRAEIGEVEVELDSGTKNEERLQRLLTDIGSLQTTFKGDIARMTETLAGYERSKAEIHQQETALRVRLASARERVEAVLHRLSALESDIETTTEKSLKIRELKEQLSSKGVTITLEITLKTRELEETIVRKDEAALALSSILDAKASRTNVLNETGEGIRKCGEELNSSKNDLHESSIEENNALHRQETVAERISTECGIGADEAYHQYQEQPDADWNALAAEIEGIRAKINELGAVNMFAVERLKELEERQSFLKTQEIDILKSREQLEDLIKKIDQESREMFAKTIETVREHFNVIFRKIFGGGKAEIIVEQYGEGPEADTGIDINVRPPGKELTNLTLLSGGEKSLTALALIMALFRANPSPFCVLDEADAALDEHNVDKFTRLINDFATETQFVVITHNKRTMAIADVLYGVTMEKRGISKKVTVNLSKGEAKPEELATLAGAAR